MTLKTFGRNGNGWRDTFTQRAGLSAILTGVVLALAPPSVAEAPKVQVQSAPVEFPTILYGAAYYHEYMPYERLDKDVVLNITQN